MRQHPWFTVCLLVGGCLLQACFASRLHHSLSLGSHGSYRILSSMKEIEPHLSQIDLVIFDIDHTLLQARTPYCHSNWFYDVFEEAIERGHQEREVLNVLVPIWERSQRDCPVRSIESFVPAFIRQIQASGVKVMALTSRSGAVANETIEQLSSLGINFQESAPLKTDQWFHGEQEVLAEDGVVFTTDLVGKGPVLSAYLQRCHWKPRRILFVDDSKRNLASVFETMSAEGVEAKLFHYPLIQRKLPYWDKRSAQQAWNKKLNPEERRMLSVFENTMPNLQSK